jgi:hypothetical protein
VTGLVVLAGIIARLSFLGWSDPWGPHHPDEGILPLEALGLWEGITPRAVGWPASTTMLALSAGAAVEWAADTGDKAWGQRHDPAAALATITGWISERFADQTPLYRLGRWTSFAAGVLVLLATVWTLSRWLGPVGVLAGTLVMALAPLAVTYSQFVLADMPGVLAAVLIVGLAANPTRRSIVLMAALAGLGAASKFHFGLWLLTPLLCIWVGLETRARTRWVLAAVTVLLCAWVIVTLVPWLWINATLGMKEFAGIVLVKIGAGASQGQFVRNLGLVLGGLSPAGWAGALLGLAALGSAGARRYVPVLVPALAGTAVIVGSQFVFDRYALVVLPAVALLAGLGWEHWIGLGHRIVRLASVAVLAGAVVATAASLVGSERNAGEVHVDVQVRRWILGHVPFGATVAVYDETVAPLPRTRAQLEACAGTPDTPEAYRHKWNVLGIDVPAGGPEPMRSTVLNDERFFAYWCRRELDLRREGQGYRVVLFHNEPRFWAIEEADAIDRFRAGLGAADPSIDVLVLNREADTGIAPAAVVRNSAGRRVIYVRPGLGLLSR